MHGKLVPAVVCLVATVAVCSVLVLSDEIAPGSPAPRISRVLEAPHLPAPFPMEYAERLSVDQLAGKAKAVGELVLPTWMPGGIQLREIYFKGVAILVYSDQETKDYREDSVTVTISKAAFRINQEGGEVQIQETGVRTVLPDGTAIPSYAIHTPTLFHALVEKEALSKEGKVAWFFTIQDLQKLFRGVDLEILRTAPLGCLHKLVIGVSPRMPPAMTPNEPVLRAIQLEEFARQNLDKMAAIEKALYQDLRIEEGLHIFIAARKPRQ